MKNIIFLLKVVKGEIRFNLVELPESEDKLDFLCDLLDCRNIDFIRLDHNIDIICDDEALGMEDCPISQIGIFGRKYNIAGNSFVFVGTDRGETVPLSMSQLQKVLRNIKLY